MKINNIKKNKNIILIIVSIIILISVVILITNLFISSHNNSSITEKIIGNWEPYKVEQNGKETPLEEYYGTCYLEYGGMITFTNDNKVIESIGCYSDEGTYKISNNVITLLFKDQGNKKIKYSNSHIEFENSSEITTFFKKISN